MRKAPIQVAFVAVAIAVSIGTGCRSATQATLSRTLDDSAPPQPAKILPASVLYMEVPRNAESRLFEIRSDNSPEAAALIDDVCRVFAEHRINNQRHHYVGCRRIPSVRIYVAIEHGDGVRSLFETDIETVEEMDAARLSSSRYHADLAACAMVKLVHHYIVTKRVSESDSIVRQSILDDAHDREWCSLTEDEM